MTTPSPLPPAPGGGHRTFAVDKGTVLAARKVILQAAEEAKSALRELRHDLEIQAPAHDDISLAATRAWNGNLQGDPDSHYARLMQYVLNVQELGVQLEEVAKQYGYTEEEIAASFNVHDRQL